MSLSFGSRLEPYEITGSLGAGGMGEVYRAIDTNLKRQVAIKVLPPSMTDDADRLSRFQREAEVARQKTTDIWVYDVDGSAIMRLTSDGQSTTPAWASDGVRLAYSSFGKGPARLFTRNADGSGSPQPLSEGTIRFAYGWFDRSTKLIFAELRDGGLDVGIVDTANGSRYRALLTSPANETRPDVSPDGRWLAYTSNELSNRDEIYVRPMADQESGKWQVSTDGGHSPIWVSGGRELVYRAPGRMMSVTIRPGETFRFDAPRSIFPDSYANDKADAATTWQLTAAPQAQRRRQCDRRNPPDCQLVRDAEAISADKIEVASVTWEGAVLRLVSNTCVAGLIATSTAVSGQAGQADIIFVGAKVVTADSSQPLAEAIALAGDRIRAVGSIEEIRRRAGVQTRSINLQGATILPGLIDAHVHLLIAPQITDEPSLRSYERTALPKVMSGFISHGITTVRSVGDPLPYIVELRDRMNPSVVGPRLVVTGPQATSPGFHAATTVCPNNPFCQTFERLLRILQRFGDAKVKLVVGTDGHERPHNADDSRLMAGARTLHEMEILRRAGLTTTDIVTAATRNGAEALGIADKVGTIAEGKLADLVILNGDFLQDFSALHRPTAVFKEGRLVHGSLPER